jgi:hypothetical protein
MSTLPSHYRKPATRCVTVISPFLRHLNTSTLAFALFVALAVLNPVGGKEPETRESAHARDAESQLIIKPCDTWLPTQQEVQRDKFTAKDFGNKVARNR